MQLQLSPIFRDLRGRVERLRDVILTDSRPLLRQAYATSVHTRFFRTGAGLQSTIEQFSAEGDRKSYQLIPTAFYMIFGEYGTGQRGRATGQPAPAGYRYGPSKGMVARRFGRLALQAIRPAVDQLARQRAAQFARNATV